MCANRRNFIKTSTAVAAGVALAPSLLFSKNPLSKIKLGIIGVGLRGRDHLDLALRRDDVEVSAICDIDAMALETSQKVIEEYGKPKAKEFTGSDESYKSLLEEDLDAVIIATPWLWHTPMAIDSMRSGKYVGVEVPVALTLEDCYQVVQVSEETGMPCMLLENVCYRRDVMAILNMVRQNMFGEMMHLECGYQHDLRHVKFNNGIQPYGGGVEFGEKGFSEAKWRTNHALHRNGDFYPTHGIGPVAQYININKGNQFTSISSFATKSRGLNEYVINQGGKDHPNTNLDWKLGDVVTSMLKTTNGETVMIQHDTSLPRPYSLGFRVQGTKGLWMDVNRKLHIEGLSPSHRWEDAKPYLEKYDHPLWKRWSVESKDAGHGGMDYYVDHAFFESVKRQVQTPIDVYDSATWSAIIPLSEHSITKGSMPIEFPDFTGGKWMTKKNTFAFNDDY